MNFYEYLELESIALKTIRDYHDGQLYAGKPYTYHLFDVESAVIERYGRDAYEERIVALLHDILEDTDYLGVHLHAKFGQKVYDAVIAMTKDKEEDYFEYIERVKNNQIARRVKLCDSFCNLKHSFMEKNKRRIMKYTTVLQLLEAD